MGAPSGAVQPALAPQSQGKGGSTPTGGAGAPAGGGKGLFSQLASQQPASATPGQQNAGMSSVEDAQSQAQSAGTGKGSASTAPVAQVQTQGGPQLPSGGQMGWQYGQGASGNRITYPSNSGQQQFGQPSQSAAMPMGAANPYSNTIGQGQQSNQMSSSGKGKGA